MMKVVKPILKILLAIIILIVVVVGAYVVYVVVTYDRIADNAEISVTNVGDEAPGQIEVDKEYTALTYNIGFGSYDQEFSFFMDEGMMSDGTATVGKLSRGKSAESVQRNTDECISVALFSDPDILLFQEVDIEADRSYDINQQESIVSAVADRLGNGSSTWDPAAFAYTYASNFHTAYLFYPPTKPIGKISESGILTLSRFEIASSVRRSFPVSDAFPTKFFDLDRCFDVNYIPATNGKALVLINTHMSAYDKGGTIRKEQMKMLADTIEKEYANGNWVIVGGDFNHALGGSESKYMHEMKRPEWVQKFDDSLLPAGCNVVIASNNDQVATCRDSSIPYVKGVNYEVVLDGFIVTDNVEASSVNIDADYIGSDHNPVKLSFKLKP